MDARKLKKQFPIFKTQKNLRYLDNAASTQTPSVVLDAMRHYYTAYRSNVHRGAYMLSAKASQAYESARDVLADTLNAHDKEIIFTSGATTALNMLAFGMTDIITQEHNIVLTRLEHHANLLPWLQLSKKVGCELRFIELTSEYHLDLNAAKDVIDNNTVVVSFAHMSNALGTIAPIKELVRLAHEHNAYAIVDGAQAIAHMNIDVRELDCDAYVFSGHKIYGPTGTGAAYVKQELLESMQPTTVGGGMIEEVHYDGVSWANLPWRFEAGTPNIAGAIGLGAAMYFRKHLVEDGFAKHENTLASEARKVLMQIEGVRIIGPTDQETPIVSFVIDGLHPHDVSSLLDDKHVAVRAGHHCTMPLMKQLGLPGTIRASFGAYNTVADVEALAQGVTYAMKRLSL